MGIWWPGWPPSSLHPLGYVSDSRGGRPGICGLSAMQVTSEISTNSRSRIRFTTFGFWGQDVAACACMCVQDFCKGMAASPSAPKTKTTSIVHVRLKAFVRGGGGGGGGGGIGGLLPVRVQLQWSKHFQPYTNPINPPI